MGFPLLRQLSTPTELFVVNLIPQPDPQPNAQLAPRRYPRFAHPFLHQLAPIEAFKFWVLDRSMQCRFDPQIAEQRISFFAQLS
jgi:hypothetical protein